MVPANAVQAQGGVIRYQNPQAPQPTQQQSAAVAAQQPRRGRYHEGLMLLLR